MGWFDVDPGYLKLGLDLLQLIGLVLLAVYTHITQRSKVNARAIEKVSAALTQRMDEKEDDDENKHGHLVSRVSHLERRMDVAEHKLTVVPTHHDMAITHKRMSRVAEQMENMSGQMVAMNRQLAMINEYLLNEKRGDK